MRALQSFPGLSVPAPRRQEAMRRRLPDADATVFYVTGLLFLAALFVVPGGI